MRRRGLLLALGIFAASLLPAAGANGATIGADIEGSFEDGIAGCTVDPFCTTLQTRVADRRTRAPFSGLVTRVGMLHPNGTLSMQVIRRKPGGEFKSIRSSGAVQVSSSPGQIVYLDVSERIREGDYVAIRSEDFGAASFAFDDSPGGPGRSKLFQPGLEDGTAGTPTSSGTGGRTYLYNAKVVR